MAADAGSEEKKELETRLKSTYAEFEKLSNSVRKKLFDEESKIYLEVYNKVAQEIATYAQTHDIDLVVRTSTEPLNAKMEPMALMQNLNRIVVYENKLDITEEIIAILKEQ